MFFCFFFTHESTLPLRYRMWTAVSCDFPQVDLWMAGNNDLEMWQVLQNQTLEQRWLVISRAHQISVPLIACFLKGRRCCCLWLLRQAFWQEDGVHIKKKPGAFKICGNRREHQQPVRKPVWQTAAFLQECFIPSLFSGVPHDDLLTCSAPALLAHTWTWEILILGNCWIMVLQFSRRLTNWEYLNDSYR